MQMDSRVRVRDRVRLGGPARRVRRAVATWALAHGVSLDFDALTVVVAAKAEAPVPVARFTEDDIWRLWWIDLSAWCARHHLAPPDGVGDALITLIAALDDTGLLADGSDRAEDLLDALDAAGGRETLARPASVS